MPQHRRKLERGVHSAFNTVEINNTFYHLPEPSVFKRWHDATPAGFSFAVKASRFITHMKKLAEPKPHVSRFLVHAAKLRAQYANGWWKGMTFMCISTTTQQAMRRTTHNGSQISSANSRLQADDFRSSGDQQSARKERGVETGADGTLPRCCPSVLVAGRWRWLGSAACGNGGCH